MTKHGFCGFQDCSTPGQAGYVRSSTRPIIAIEREDLEALGVPGETDARFALKRAERKLPDAWKQSESGLWTPGLWLGPKWAQQGYDAYLKTQETMFWETRSERERSLVWWHCLSGWSTRDIIDKALGDGWPKAVEKAQRSPKKPDRWIRQAIRSARDHLLYDYDRHLLTFSEGGPPVGKRRELALLDLLAKVSEEVTSVEGVKAELARLSESARAKRGADRKFARMVAAGFIAVHGEQVKRP